jgi:hypothetical protein
MPCPNAICAEIVRLVSKLSRSSPNLGSRLELMSE